MTARSFDVRVWKLQRYAGSRGVTHTVRWRVATRTHQRTFATKKLAEAFKTDLAVAARDGQAFEVATGLPSSMRPAAPVTTWLEHAMAYVGMKWPRASARHRRSIAEALTDITLAVTDSQANRPDQKAMRRVLFAHAFNMTSRGEQMPADLVRPWDWLQRNSPPVDVLASRGRLRAVLERLATRQDGAAAAAATMARKRATLHNVLEYAVELDLLTVNPLKTLSWTAPQATDVVDNRVVVNPSQARDLLGAAWLRDPAVAAFFACMYYAGLRPGEARSLRLEDCALPSQGWGQLLLVGSHQDGGAAWTDSGLTGEFRSLKHRGERDTRPVPAHPELVASLMKHLDRFETGAGGLLFVTRTGRAGVPLAPPYLKPVSSGTIYRAWHRTRTAALSEREVTSLLARRPYDLRHACLSTWLNAGVAPAQVAEWAGHSVEVLLRVYAKCVVGDDEIALARIEAALR